MEKIGEIKDRFTKGIEALKTAYTITAAQEAAACLEELEFAGQKREE